MTNANRARKDVTKLLEDLKDRVWAIAEAYEQVLRAVDFRERGDRRRARLCDEAARAALRCAIDIEQHAPRAANDD